jgi:hypothetical protein
MSSKIELTDKAIKALKPAPDGGRSVIAENVLDRQFSAEALNQEWGVWASPTPCCIIPTMAANTPVNGFSG